MLNVVEKGKIRPSLRYTEEDHGIYEEESSLYEVSLGEAHLRSTGNGENIEISVKFRRSEYLPLKILPDTGATVDAIDLKSLQSINPQLYKEIIKDK